MRSLYQAHVVIAGGVSGLGLATARACLRQSANVTIIGRTARACKQAQAWLKPDLAPGCWIQWEVCDLGSLAATEALTERLGTGEPIDVLIGQADIRTPTYQLSVDGLELMFATNVLSHYGLVAGLARSLAASKLRTVLAATCLSKHASVPRSLRVVSSATFDVSTGYDQSQMQRLHLQAALSPWLEPLNISVRTIVPDVPRACQIGQYLCADQGSPKLWRALIRRPDVAAQEVIALIKRDDLTASTDRYWRRGRPDPTIVQWLDPDLAHQTLEQCRQITANRQRKEGLNRHKYA